MQDISWLKIGDPVWFRMDGKLVQSTVKDVLTGEGGRPVWGSAVHYRVGPEPDDAIGSLFVTDSPDRKVGFWRDSAE